MRFNTQLRPAGYTIVTDIETGKVEESDTKMCGHCGKHFESKRRIWTPWSEKKVRRGYCQLCGPLCGGEQCAQHDGRIHPHEKRIELAEKGVEWNDQYHFVEKMPVSSAVPELWTP